MLQLPRDVLVDIVQRVGSREKWALCATCQTLRKLTLPECAMTFLHPTEAFLKRRPLLIGDPADACPKAVRIEGASLPGLLCSSHWLVGIKELELVRGGKASM
jgi:hypothetical protein